VVDTVIDRLINGLFDGMRACMYTVSSAKQLYRFGRHGRFLAGPSELRFTGN